MAKGRMWIKIAQFIMSLMKYVMTSVNPWLYSEPQNCIMISQSSGIVNIENIIDHKINPIDSRVARPLMRIVADKNNKK